MSGSRADLEGAIARLEKAITMVETRVRLLKAQASVPVRDDDLFAGGDRARERELEGAAAEAQQALDKAAAEIRAVLETV